MALPTQGRVLLDTTAGDIDIELWSKVRGATMTCDCLCNKYISFTGSTESMPEFHSVGYGRYALSLSLSLSLARVHLAV
jgi:hypothetical protein